LFVIGLEEGHRRETPPDTRSDVDLGVQVLDGKKRGKDAHCGSSAAGSDRRGHGADFARYRVLIRSAFRLADAAESIASLLLHS